jgi:hypothetical protein
VRKAKTPFPPHWRVFDRGDREFVIDFDYEHAGMVEVCKRKQIITRGHRLQPNDLLYLVHGKGSTYCRRLRSTHCVEALPVRIEPNKSIWQGNIVLRTHEAQRFAREDGHDSLDAFIEFYRAMILPLDGQVVRWM